MERLLSVGQAARGRLEPSPAAAEVGKHVELRERGRVGGLYRGDAARGGCGTRRGGGQAAGVSVLRLQAAAGRLAELGDEPGGHQLHPAALSVAAPGWEVGVGVKGVGKSLCRTWTAREGKGRRLVWGRPGFLKAEKS